VQEQEQEQEQVTGNLRTEAGQTGRYKKRSKNQSLYNPLIKKKKLKIRTYSIKVLVKHVTIYHHLNISIYEDKVPLRT
jgi:hypothetical protein